MTTVFIAGLHHETNTFAPSPADWAAFKAGAGDVPHARGRAMLTQMAPSRSAIGGFVEAARLVVKGSASHCGRSMRA